MADYVLQLKNINKYFGKNHVIKNVNLNFEKGHFITFLGPSGCGKTEYSAVGVPPVRQGVPFVRRGVPLAIFR